MKLNTPLWLFSKTHLLPIRLGFPNLRLLAEASHTGRAVFKERLCAPCITES